MQNIFFVMINGFFQIQFICGAKYFSSKLQMCKNVFELHRKLKVQK